MTRRDPQQTGLMNRLASRTKRIAAKLGLPEDKVAELTNAWMKEIGKASEDPDTFLAGKRIDLEDYIKQHVGKHEDVSSKVKELVAALNEGEAEEPGWGNIETQADFDAYSARVDKWFQDNHTHAITIRPCDDCKAEFGEEAYEHCEHNQEPHFSWRPCEICNRSLGGDRHSCNFYDDQAKEIFDVDVCDDCYYYAEYGQLDDTTMMNIEDAEKKHGEENFYDVVTNEIQSAVGQLVSEGSTAYNDAVSDVEHWLRKNGLLKTVTDIETVKANIQKAIKELGLASEEEPEDE